MKTDRLRPKYGCFWESFHVFSVCCCGPTPRLQYDFSKGERGKFYRKNAKLNLPIYLDDDVLQFVEGVAKKKKMDIQTVVNRLLKNDIEIAELLQ